MPKDPSTNETNGKEGNPLAAKDATTPTALAALLLFCLATTVAAQEQSGCVTCHLDETMLVKNLNTDKIKTSTMQSGAG